MGACGSRGPKQVDPQEPATERRAIGGPDAFAPARGHYCTRRAHLRIQIVQIVKRQSLAEHRQLRGTKLVLAVMADQQMLDERFQIRRKIGIASIFFVTNSSSMMICPSSWPSVGVVDGALVGQLIELADIVQDGAGQQQIGIEFRGTGPPPTGTGRKG